MPTRKQRRRRAKEHRHEYVWEDDEGNELEPEEVPTRKASAQPRQPVRGARQAQPPSWRRTFRRAAIFVPVMFVVISLLGKNLSLADRLLQTALIVVVFVPFSYFLDGLFWRSYQRRVAKTARSNGHRRS
jgi:hypothetical protein